MRKLAIWLMVLAMLTAPALAEINWPGAATEAQKQLQTYVGRVNENLTTLGQGKVNAVFEWYETFASLGVTAQDNGELPEGVEMTFLMDGQGLQSLQLRVSDSARFTALAAACIQASSPDAITLEEAMSAPSACAQRTADSPYAAFEEPVNATPGEATRLYWAYFPDEYSDGVNWWQMTLVFPLPGSEGAPVSVTPEPVVMVGEDTEYDANLQSDEFTHLEVFVTATPEPDSAANE